MKKTILIALIICATIFAESFSCTIIMVSDSRVVLVGSNEDSMFPLTMMWYIPASDGNYARICFGYKMVFNSLQGGMNEKGLFLDGNSLGKQGWEQDNNKKALFGPLLDRILATCANIEEVKEFFNTYNTPNLDRARIPIMDTSGASMIVEWYNGEVVFLETDKAYQIATNFVGSKYIGKEKPGWRYKRAFEILEPLDSFSIDVVREALDATHQENDNSRTVYSFICDLKSGDIYVYNYHDFSKPLVLNFEDEFLKDKSEYFLSELFLDNSPQYKEFIEDGSIKMIELGYNTNIYTAFVFFNVLKTNYPRAFNKEIGIGTLSLFGKNLAANGKLEDAIKILEQNTREFPDEVRSHLELANIYLINNNREKAIQEYNNVLLIDPDHIKAKKVLDELMKQS